MPRRHGFTLIELLIVVVILGILAAIAIPKFQNTKGKANLAALKSDLHNLATIQEAYFYDHATYSSDLDDLKYRPSPGVAVTVDEASGRGWLAKAKHLGSSPTECAIYFGAITKSASPATAEGQVACADSP
jgi:type IV pilus assembly protein PilA